MYVSNIQALRPHRGFLWKPTWNSWGKKREFHDDEAQMQGQNSAVTPHCWGSRIYKMQMRKAALQFRIMAFVSVLVKSTGVMWQMKSKEGKYMSSRWRASAFSHGKNMYEYEWILSGVKKLLATPSLQPSILLLSLNGVFKSCYRRWWYSLTIWVKKGKKIVFSGVSGTATANITTKAFFFSSSERAPESGGKEMGVVWI